MVDGEGTPPTPDGSEKKPEGGDDGQKAPEADNQETPPVAEAEGGAGDNKPEDESDKQPEE